MTANPASVPIPSTVVLPRMGRGVRWSDMAREIELDETERQARNSQSGSSLEQLGAALDAGDFAEALDIRPELVAAEEPDQTVTLDEVVELHRAVVIAEALAPLPSRRGWLPRGLRRLA